MKISEDYKQKDAILHGDCSQGIVFTKLFHGGSA